MNITIASRLVDIQVRLHVVAYQANRLRLHRVASAISSGYIDVSRMRVAGRTLIIQLYFRVMSELGRSDELAAGQARNRPVR
jgi:hypothetical protein